MRPEGKTPAMLIGFGSAVPKGKEEDGGDSPGAMAGEALADAVKSGDGQAIFDAFETLYRECSRGSESDEDDMDEDEDAL